jgi:hypothetical protein
VCEADPVSMWGTCAFKVRAGHKCGRPAVGHRDLVGQYPKGLTRQAVCELHQRAVDHKPPPLAHPDAPDTGNEWVGTAGRLRFRRR